MMGSIFERERTREMERQRDGETERETEGGGRTRNRPELQIRYVRCSEWGQTPIWSSFSKILLVNKKHHLDKK